MFNIFDIDTDKEERRCLAVLIQDWCSEATDTFPGVAHIITGTKGVRRNGRDLNITLGRAPKMTTIVSNCSISGLKERSICTFFNVTPKRIIHMLIPAFCATQFYNKSCDTSILFNTGAEECYVDMETIKFVKRYCRNISVTDGHLTYQYDSAVDYSDCNDYSLRTK